MAPGIAEREQAPLGAGSQDADEQEARGEVHRQLAVGRADGRVTKEAADAPQASAFSAEPAPAAAPTTQSAPSSEGAARNEAAPLAQQAVIPSTTLEERPARERKAQDVGAGDALSLRDAAPAPGPAAANALEKTGNVPETLLRSLKARRAARLGGHDESASPEMAAKALAAGTSRSGGHRSLDELDARFQWPASLRPLVTRAESLSVIANTVGAAGGHDRAASAWERVFGASREGSDAQLEAQSRSAYARRDAWRSGPTAARKAQAVEALQDLLVLLPPGPRRHEAELRLGEVMRSGE